MNGLHQKRPGFPEFLTLTQAAAWLLVSAPRSHLRGSEEAAIHLQMSSISFPGKLSVALGRTVFSSTFCGRNDG